MQGTASPGIASFRMLRLLQSPGILKITFLIPVPGLDVIRLQPEPQSTDGLVQGRPPWSSACLRTKWVRTNRGLPSNIPDLALR